MRLRLKPLLLQLLLKPKPKIRLPLKRMVLPSLLLSLLKALKRNSVQVLLNLVVVLQPNLAAKQKQVKRQLQLQQKRNLAAKIKLLLLQVARVKRPLQTVKRNLAQSLAARNLNTNYKNNQQKGCPLVAFSFLYVILTFILQ